MILSYQLVTPPAIEPVSLDLAKLQLRVDFDDDDALITGYITAARQYAEKVTNRAFFTQTWTLFLDHFPLPRFQTTLNSEQRKDWPYFGSAWDYYAIKLPKPRCIAVQSVTYLDMSSTLQTLDPSTFYVDTASEPARLVPKQNLFWPYTQQYLPGSVRITYTAGSYGDGVTVNTCPQTICLAILLLVSHWYEHREDATELNLKNIPLGVEALLATETFHAITYDTV